MIYSGRFAKYVSGTLEEEYDCDVGKMKKGSEVLVLKIPTI